MEAVGLALISIILAYLLGSQNGAYYMMKWKHGIDIRTTGSGNAGATNAGRAMGKTGFFWVLVFDLAKGMLAVLLIRWSGQTELVAGLGVIAAVMGHIFPIQLRFKGGKGIAVSLGAFVIYSFQATFLLLAVFLCIYLFLRRFSISGLLAYACTAVLLPFLRLDMLTIAIYVVVTVLILAAHHTHLKAAWSYLLLRNER
ncbi:glycerol-3-phosphate 1-O-acyltransferase PlsY [Terribacillus saccharophilus]|uniref:glycerol-3-phosphate 1-O-acyltransferase PlsY n=1 Tax=Terribacillus saccharophilus TaxID=361277 RepID=UPI0006910949|nr:glycerol-3-phosphate 1-O-acyltransferase PlsY [Terribacillus goriensis]MEC0283400.1 glycerol-3-phosphate 1-O-acyltransferase PlsY [Terribacillus saccharophilus]MEC0290356.1 glycerol-3-phosphate 1-O-acyltransferase PlsY [Terribacillus saccharophilus]